MRTDPVNAEAGFNALLAAFARSQGEDDPSQRLSSPTQDQLSGAHPSGRSSPAKGTSASPIAAQGILNHVPIGINRSLTLSKVVSCQSGQDIVAQSTKVPAAEPTLVSKATNGIPSKADLRAKLATHEGPEKPLLSSLLIGPLNNAPKISKDLLAISWPSSNAGDRDQSEAPLASRATGDENGPGDQRKPGAPGNQEPFADILNSWRDPKGQSPRDPPWGHLNGLPGFVPPEQLEASPAQLDAASIDAQLRARQISSSASASAARQDSRIADRSAPSPVSIPTFDVEALDSIKPTPIGTHKQPTPASDAPATQNSAAQNHADSAISSVTLGAQAKQPVPSSVAFAMRLSVPDENISDSKEQPGAAPPLKPIGVAAGPHAVTTAIANVPSAGSENQREHGSDFNQNAAPFAETLAKQSSPDTQFQAQQQPSTPETSDLGDSLNGPQPGETKNVHLTLAADSNQRVDVRLFDQGGALHVSVKTENASLAQSLQDHMPELTASLDQHRFQSEVWTPHTAKTNQSNSSDTGASTSGNLGASSQENHGRRQNGNQNKRPDWADALENYS